MQWLLLTHSTEAFKRNNSGFHVKKVLGRAVSIVFWQRKAQNLISEHPQVAAQSPVLLFPKAYVSNDEVVVSERIERLWQGRPFIIIDATWQQAKKMYRQSEWLQSLDVLSLPVEQDPVLDGFEYRLRKGQKEGGCSTVEVVARTMALGGELREANSLLSYFSLFQMDNNDPSR